MTAETPAETATSGIATLNNDSPDFSDGPWPVRGVALPEDITTQANSQGETVYWPPEAARAVAEELEGKKITDPSEHDPESVVDNPQPSPETILGEITDARYEPGVGAVYEGEIDDPEIAKRVQRGRVDVSPVIFRTLADSELEDGARPVDNVVGVRDLSVVAEGEATGNSIEPATAAMARLSASALSAVFGAEGSASAEVLTVSTPEFTGYSEAAWDAPTLEGTFDGDMESARNSATWIDDGGENFGDLSLFVLNGEGELNTNALDAAWRMASQTDGPSEDDVRRLRALYEDLAIDANEAGAISDDEFDNVWQDRIDAEANSAADPTPGDDGALDDEPPSTGGQTSDNGTMTEDNDITDAERELLATADDPEEATEVLQDYRTCEEPRIVEQDDLDAQQERVETLESFLDEALVEERGLKEATVEAMSIDAKAAEFEDDDGNLEAEALIQTPESGSADTAEVASADDEDVAEILDEYDVESVSEAQSILRKRHERFQDMGWDSHASEAEQQLETLGVEL